MAEQKQNEEQIQIEITSPIKSRNGVSNGREYTAHSQDAYLHRPSERYPEKISFAIESPNDQLKEGFYHIDFDSSLMVGQWNALSFSRYLQLVPVKRV